RPALASTATHDELRPRRGIHPSPAAPPCESPAPILGGQAGRFARRGVLLRLDSVELHPVAQLVALELEQLGGATLVPLGSIRGAQDQGALQLLDQRLERDAVAGERPRNVLVGPLPDRALRG